MGWMAQYPGEKEVTFPPYTGLESHGDPRVEQTEEGELIIFPLKAPPLPPFPPRLLTALLQCKFNRRADSSHVLDSKVPPCRLLRRVNAVQLRLRHPPIRPIYPDTGIRRVADRHACLHACRPPPHTHIYPLRAHGVC